MPPRKSQTSEADALFEVEPSAFIRERDAAAKKLREKGSEAEAKRVKLLRKPTPAVFGINQLARNSPQKVQALLDASAELTKASRAAMGPKDPAKGEALRKALRARDSAVAAARTAVVKILKKATPAVKERVDASLKALALGEAALRKKLETGTVEEEVELDPFLGFAGVTSAPSTGASSKRSDAVVDDDEPTATRKRSSPRYTAKAPGTKRASAEEERKRAREEAAARRAEAKEKRDEARESSRREKAERARKSRVAVAQKKVERLSQQLADAKRALANLQSSGT